MIFGHTLEKVLSGEKTQTRRLVGPEERLYLSVENLAVIQWRKSKWTDYVKWEVGRTYAVQPGRGKPAVGRILLKNIWQEQLRDITEEGAIAEGCEGKYFDYIFGRDSEGGPIVDVGYIPPVEVYFNLWDRIHTKPGTRWIDNPKVWVLEFELAEKGE